MGGKSTRLSSSVTVAQYLILEQAGNREALGRFIQERFNERYLRPVEASQEKHGFTMLAIGCLAIETLESFYQGKANTKGESEKMFNGFFSRDTPFKVFAGNNGWFYKNIRCGILHQAETRGGWRVLRTGPLLDASQKTINAARFCQELRKAVAYYAKQIESDDSCWQNFQKKMRAICDNCSRS
ncbi:MAG: hypothetical protein HYS19_04735 [Nitrosomonadales bacterium]|nr:hypothetical protein [Nitrosomonadales bacterium]